MAVIADVRKKYELRSTHHFIQSTTLAIQHCFPSWSAPASGSILAYWSTTHRRQVLANVVRHSPSSLFIWTYPEEDMGNSIVTGYFFSRICICTGIPRRNLECIRATASEDSIHHRNTSFCWIVCNFKQSPWLALDNRDYKIIRTMRSTEHLLASRLLLTPLCSVRAGIAPRAVAGDHGH